MLRWPEREDVREAVRRWGASVLTRDGVTRVGCFGSLAAGGWGVGSDVDLVVIVDTSTEPPDRRSLAFDASSLPVPADVLVYTRNEWERSTAAGRDPVGPVEWLDAG